MQLRAHATTDTGPRPRNEDYHCVAPELGLFAVADGMGGMEGGDIASRLAVTSLRRFFERAPIDRLRGRDFASIAGEMGEAVATACREVARASIGPLSEMGTTLAAVLVCGDHALIAHVGDSRVYRIRRGSLERLTRDHSMIAEMEAALGSVSPAIRHAFGHIVTRHIGASEDPTPECQMVNVQPGDRFLICTDGVTDVLEDHEIERTVCSARSADDACNALVRHASMAGSQDNVTVVVIDVEAGIN